MAFKKRRNKTKKNKRKLIRKSWSDHLVANLLKNQFKSRVWRRVREYFNAFFPSSAEVHDISSTSQQQQQTLVPSGSSNNNQQDIVLKQIFGAKSKLFIHGLSLWYDVVSFLLSKERLILDSERLYTGSVGDYLAKTYKELGLLACLSNREVMGPIARFLVSTLYTVSVQMPIIDTIHESVESPLVRQLIRRIDDVLLMAVNYPIDTTCLMKFKRVEQNQPKMSLVQSMKHIRQENGISNGWYRGFGWNIVETLLSETTSSLLTSGITSLFCKLFDVDCEISNEPTISLTADQLLLFNKLQSTTVDLLQDILLAPLRYSILRYRTDTSYQYTSPIDCFKQVHSKEGFRTFYKGTWLGTFLATSRLQQ